MTQKTIIENGGFLFQLFSPFKPQPFQVRCKMVEINGNIGLEDCFRCVKIKSRR